MLQQFDSLISLFRAFPDEQTCIDHFRSIRWKDGAYCPYCASHKVYHFADNRTHKCGECRKRFSIKVGTIFADTKLPLQTWYAAIWLITNHKKGIASTTLATDLKITQKSAWFVLHRLRYAARTQSFNMPLEGEVEVDESFFGGKAKNRHAQDRKRGRGTTGKAPVAGAVERGGRVIARAIPDTKGETLQKFVRDHVSRDVKLLATDEFHGYWKLAGEYPHEYVRHSDGEFVSGSVHTQTIDGFWSQLKRQIYGIHHFVSVKHLDRYAGEAAWRYSHRDGSTSDRVNGLLAATNGRLTYKTLIA